MKTALLSTIVSATLITASPLVGRDATEGTLACDGTMRPDWTECDAFIKAESWIGPDSKEGLEPGSDEPCITIGAPSHNCAMELCKGKGRKKIYGDEVYAAYKMIKEQCEGTDSGGAIIAMDGKDNSVGVFNNEDYKPSKRSPFKRKHNKRDALANKLIQRGLLQSREDKEFKVDSFAFSVTRSNKAVKYGSTAPGGSTVSISKAETNEWHTEASSEVSAGIEGFLSTSLSITMGESHSNTNTKTETYMIACDKNQEGQLYWFPHWNVYYGTLKPSGKKLEVYVPLDGEDGEFQVTCLG